MTNSSSRSVFVSKTGEEDVRGISKRVSQITVSAIKQMPVLAHEIGGCVSLGQGIPSLNTPEYIREAVIEELKTNPNIGKYTLQPGLPELREKIAAAVESELGMSGIDPNKNVFVSCGAMEGIAAALATVVDRGDQVILLSPCYSSHIEQVLFAEGEPIFIPLREERGWQPDLEELKGAITDKTKAIIVCNPCNPTGSLFSDETLTGMAEIIAESGIFVLADETYDFLVFDGEFKSLASFEELRDQLILVRSFSKKFCMTGWRVGYLVAPERIVSQVLKVHDAFAICAPAISQFAALAALSMENDSWSVELVSTLRRRRDLAVSRLDRLSSVFTYNKPAATYYIFPKLVGEQTDSMQTALSLLHDARVITIPGVSFGPSGEGHLRFSFGGTEEDLSLAFDRIERWVDEGCGRSV